MKKTIHSFILTAKFLDFLACFPREEFFVINFRGTSYLDEDMQPLVAYIVAYTNVSAANKLSACLLLSWV